MTLRFPGDPGIGNPYFGQSILGGDPSSRESYYGTNVQTFRSYFHPNEVGRLVSVARRDTAAGRLPIVSTKVPGSWSSVGSGGQDSWLHSLMNGLDTVPGPVWLCFHHEPYDDDPSGAAAYCSMYTRAATMKPANVALCPILQSAPFDPTVFGSHNIAPWYNAAADIIGIDQYNHWYYPSGNRWREPDEMMEFIDTLDSTFGKPVCIAEYGVRSDPSDPGRAATWLQGYYDTCVSRGFVVALSYFDSSANVNDGGTPWSLDYGGNERLAKFKQILTGSSSPVPSFTNDNPPDGFSTVSYTFTFAAAGTPDPTFAVHSGSLPAGLSLNSSTGVLSGTPTTIGSSTFTLRATNSAGHADTSAITVAIASGAPSAPTLTAESPPTTATTRTSYYYQFTASGFEPPTYTVDSGALPDGLSLNSASGVLSGSPTAPGTFTFTVTATNDTGDDTSDALVIVVTGSDPVADGFDPGPQRNLPRVSVSPGTGRTAARSVDTFGVLQLVAHGSHDITTFRGVPVQILGWGSVDPGGHDAASFYFPQITLADLGNLGSGDLDWYGDGVLLRIDQVLDGDVIQNLWRGRAHAVNVRDARVTIEADGDMIGPMSWATYRPDVDRTVEDIGWSISKQVPLSSFVTIDPALPDTGILMERTGSRSDSRWAWCTSVLALAQTRGGVQWTLLPNAADPGTYNLVQRDLTSHDLTVHLGVPGVDADLLRDITARPTRYYGEGQRPDGGRWYGAVFPYLDLVAPDFPNTGGTPMVLGDANADTDSGDGIMLLFRTLGRYGMSYDDVRDTFTRKMKDIVEDVQDNAGLPVTGEVDPDTWDVIFNTDTPASLYGAHYEPLVARSAVRALNRASNGSILGDNPDYNPDVPVVDSFVGFGVGVEKADAREWCRTQMQQDFTQPQWDGTVTLTTDPEEMSRFAIRAGMNLWDPGFGDTGAVFHIASVAVDWSSGAVTCEVSTRGRDYLDLSTILERNRAARSNPSKRFANQLSRRSALSQDMRPGWDYEGGAGIVAETACPGGEWTVVPVFCGQAGSVGEVHFRATDDQTEYAVAIFAKAVTPGHLNAIAPDPLAERADDGSWVTDPDAKDELFGFYSASYDDDAEVNASGRTTNGRLLVYAAGTPTTPTDAPLPCGYWPHTDAGKPDNDSLGSNLTGVWKDDAAFDYWTYDKPFLYVAIWPRGSCTIRGRLYPSMTDGGM